MYAEDKTLYGDIEQFPTDSVETIWSIWINGAHLIKLH